MPLASCTSLTFKQRTDLPVYTADMLVYDVFNEDGTQLAIFTPWTLTRSNKRGGAWANAYVGQSGLLNRKPVIANNLNIPKPEVGQPTLMTFDEVNTMFHEFGHALHGMFSNVKYPRFAGTSVPRDFVEYPSQVNEMWALCRTVPVHYNRHQNHPGSGCRRLAGCFCCGVSARRIRQDCDFQRQTPRTVAGRARQRPRPEYPDCVPVRSVVVRRLPFDLMLGRSCWPVVRDGGNADEYIV